MSASCIVQLAAVVKCPAQKGSTMSNVTASVLSGATVLDALCQPIVAEKKTKVKKGRPFYAAVVVQENGFTAEITDAMVARVDELCGKPNKVESLAWLKIAQQMVAGCESAREAAKN